MREQLLIENKELISKEGTNAVFSSKMRENYLKMKEFMTDLEFENETYSILVPEDINSFIKEGDELIHAVGTSYYLSKILTGEIIVLFCRKKRHLSKPFYTIAIDANNKLVMAKGLRNKEVFQYVNAQSLQSFINEWLKIKKITI